MPLFMLFFMFLSHVRGRGEVRGVQRAPPPLPISPLTGERRKNYEALSLLLMLVTSLSGRRMMGREVVAGVRVRF